jgi:hypothetical protein
MFFQLISSLLLFQFQFQLNIVSAIATDIPSVKLSEIQFNDLAHQDKLAGLSVAHLLSTGSQYSNKSKIN